jgi:hypothetical protein
MQFAPIFDNISLITIGIITGLIFGYIIGGVSSFSFNYRIGLGIVISLFSGMITGLLIIALAPVLSSISPLIESFQLLLLILSNFGGYILGAMANWAPLPEKAAKRHVVFELDDDDQFDREIEEAMGGDYKADNS